MRLWHPTIRHQRILFSQRFQNLSYVLGSGGSISGSVSVDRGLDTSGGGYVVYNSRGADGIWQLPWWSVYVEVDVPASGSQRAIVACGDPVIGDRFELGLSASNEMQIIGTSTVVSDDAVSAGKRKLLWIYTGGVIEFWVDGVRIGTATVTLGSNRPPRLYVGVASDGSSRKLGETIYRLDCYSYPLDEAEAFLVSAVEGWTPRSLLSAYGGTFTDGMYFDGDEDGSFSLNTQPTDLDLRFFDPSLWTRINAAHTIGGGRLVAGVGGGVGTTYANQGIAFNRYRIGLRVEVSDRLMYGYAGGYRGAGSVGDTGWVYAELTSSNTRLGLATGAGNYAVLRQWSVENLSCTHLNPYGSGALAGSRFAQLTDADMPWQDGGMRSDGSGDRVQSDSAATNWKWMHDGSGGTAAFLLRSEGVTSSVQSVFDTMRNSNARIGASLQYDSRANERFSAYIGNGSGTYAFSGTTPNNVVSAGDWAVVIMRVQSASLSLRIDGVEYFGGAVSSPSASDPTYTNTIGGLSGGTAQELDGQIRKAFFCNGYVGGSNLTLLENYLMRAAA